MNRAELQQHYEAAKAKLNPEQRRAVETIDGPVMVLAGPGTGKTQVLAFRIAEILQQTDAAPRNILALTFTESGVAAMRERLASLIGVAAYGVGIYTFHSFANRVINDAGAEFYKNHSLDPIDDISQLKLIISLIAASECELLKPLRAPHFYVKPVISAIKNLKNEGVAPDSLRRLCREEIEALETDPKSISQSGKSKGQLKQAVKDQIERLERSLALADVYARYQVELVERGLYDYEDMILSVIESFQTNPSLKAQYQEQFQYILVDEYQDTNSAQNTLVRLLADYFENPNIFVVGDDKQSIYRFQGASMANLLSFREWYPAAELISLRQNYRSGQAILDTAHTLIDHNHEQLAKVLPAIETNLQAQSTDSSVGFTHYATQDNEALGMVERIKSLLDGGTKASEIAIIYRENSEAQQFTDLLARQGIAFHLESGSDVLKDMNVQQLMNLLELAARPDNEFAFFRYIHAPYSGVATTDLLALGRWRKRNRTNWFTLLEGDPPDTDFPLATWQALQTARDKVQTWYRYQANHNIGDTVEHIFTDSELLAFMMQQPDHLERLHRLRCFFEEVKHVMNSVHFATLSDLFDRFEIRQTYNIPLVCAPLVERSDDAIRLMTAHKSKGLEFAYVFIPHLYDGLWGNGRKRDALRLPASIIPHHTVNEEQEIEEDRRLFYVALTRAKQAVYLSCAELDGSNKKLMPSQFVAELEGIAHEAPSGSSQLSITAFFSPVETQFVSATSRAYLQDIAAKQAITPTGLNTFLTCPLEYLYKEVYCIPGVREPFQAYGTAIHKALEMWGTWSKSGEQTVSLPLILSVFAEALVKEGLTEDEVARYRKLGEDVLTAYFEQFALSWVPPLATEYSFTPHAVMLDGKIPITGKIDKIEPIKGSKSVRVIDFKTGRVKSRNDILGQTAASDGDYYRQLVFYTVLAEADPFFPYSIGEASIAFMDDQKKFTIETFEISRQEREDVQALIRSVYKEITELHFPHTPHKQQFGKGESLCDLLRVTVSPLMPTESRPLQPSETPLIK